GLEAPLQYIFDQSLAANIFDQRGYALKLNLSVGECGNYTDAADVRADQAKYDKCNQNLGPNQPGITTPDPSATRSTATTHRRTRRHRRHSAGSAPAATPAPAATAAPTATPHAPLLGLRPVQDLIDQTAKLVPGGSNVTGTTNDLLDFLLRP
ncbi:MAG: hypothetical protein QOI80_3089, partial [Solirubrobacteraceae bacterium]|nr:hypothetical protein [Solirubrobacteraceae bacterium]